MRAADGPPSRVSRGGRNPGGCPPPDAAPKTDIVVLENGDRITCEVKGLSRGRLSAGTDRFDTVDVYWDRVQHVTSTQIFEVETSPACSTTGS